MIQELINVIENYVELDDAITESARFKQDLGLSSFDTVCMISEIKTVIGVELQPADFVKYKTVGEMAEYISSLK
ncbi:MAG: acyl carrier protein [Faecalibacterium sp.]|nr:acyl carrier protein [Ruminococcus sp.]MCM1392780.1 acyl carrier protein [Ruminococcus sp.]MCM1486080.1 acyl carrier protein [Faecalibacterium sp.]